ncbi:MAG: hypothetical protein ACK5LK_11570 [Chthoniobacterales bacterium]
MDFEAFYNFENLRRLKRLLADGSFVQPFFTAIYFMEVWCHWQIRASQNGTKRCGLRAGRRVVAPPSTSQTMKIKIEKYNHRNWAIYDSENNLIAVTVYKKGAMRVTELLSVLPHKPIVIPETLNPYLSS